MVILILKLIEDYGIPGMLKILRSWDVLDPTDSDIDELYSKVMSPTNYFAGVS